ncbi:ABC transporter permease subunit [Bacillaceae bacterium]
MRIIAKLAFKETLYKRIFPITLLMTLAFLLFYGLGTHFAADKLAEDMENWRAPTPDKILQKNFFSTQFLGMGLYFASFITGLLAILGSVGSIAGEIESHQIDTWLARPLPRRSVVLGKFLGLGSLLVAYAGVQFLGIITINQALGGETLKVHLAPLQILGAFGLFVLQPLILVAVALFLSSRMATVNGGVILILLYGIGLVGGFLEQIGASMENRTMVNIGILSSLLFPLDSLFRRMAIALFDAPGDPLSFASQGLFGSVSMPSDAMLVYTVLYGVAALWLAVRTFEKRDL